MRGDWLNLQDLVMRGATPNGPAYGYKQVLHDADDGHGVVSSHYSNPLNQQMRGGWLNLQMLNKRGATPSGPVFGYKLAHD